MPVCILEILSGEELVLRLQRVHQNAKELWPGFLIGFVLIFLVDFFLFVPFPAFRMWRPLYLSLLGIIAIYALAGWAINKKYVRPQGIPIRASKVNVSFLLVIIAAYLLEIILLKASGFIHIGDFYGRHILAFIFNYVHVFEFIFCSLFILDVYPQINKKFNGQKEIFVINPMSGGIFQSLSYWFSFVARLSSLSLWY